MITLALQHLFDDFALLDDWEDRYRYLIDLGNKLPPFPEALRTETALVEGCMSRVWLAVEARTEGGPLVFHADSDAHIVRGLIGVLRAAYAGLTPADVRQVDIESAFERLGLGQHISANRRNGFVAMTARLRALAGEGPPCATGAGEKTPHEA